MRIVQANEIEQLLSITPNTQDNAAVISALQDLYGELRVVKEPFTYVATFAAIPAGTTPAPFNIAIDASAVFVVCNQTYNANLAGAAQTSSTIVIPNVTYNLVDQGSGRNLMSANVAVTENFGNGQFPYVLPEPIILAPNSVLQVSVTSLEAASTPNLRLSFNGYKLKSLAR